MGGRRGGRLVHRSDVRGGVVVVVGVGLALDTGRWLFDLVVCVHGAASGNLIGDAAGVAGAAAGVLVVEVVKSAGVAYILIGGDPLNGFAPEPAGLARAAADRATGRAEVAESAGATGDAANVSGWDSRGRV